MTADEDNNICIKCGMCCDGTLFQFASIDANESIDANYSFDVGNNEAHDKVFFLPCTYLHDKCCTIYDHRPYKVCDHYRCVTLRRLEGEEISLDAALETIRETLAIKEEIRLMIESDFHFITGRTLNEKIFNFEKYYSTFPDVKEFESKYRKLLMDVVKFKLLKDRFFYKSKHQERLD